jgi:glutaredoxin
MLIIYGNSNCVYCNAAKKLADSKGVEYEYRNLDEDRYYNEFKILMNGADKVTIPQIWWDDKYIGGFDQFQIEINKLY